MSIVKKILIGGAIAFAVLLLNECSNPNWFNGGGDGCGRVISSGTWLGDLFNIKPECN